MVEPRQPRYPDNTVLGYSGDAGGVGDTIPHLTYMSTLSGEKERKGKRSEGAARQFRHHGSADDHTLPHWFAVLVGGGGEVG